MHRRVLSPRAVCIVAQSRLVGLGQIIRVYPKPFVSDMFNDLNRPAWSVERREIIPELCREPIHVPFEVHTPTRYLI